MPEGSDLALRVTGGSGAETLAFTDSAGAMRDLDAGRRGEADAGKPAAGRAAPTRCAQFFGKLTADGALSLKSGEQELRSWAFTVIPDKPPVIRFAGEPKRAVNGALELAYEIEDDYGAASAEAEFELADAAGRRRAAALRRAGNAADAAAPRRQGAGGQDLARPDRACLVGLARSS